MGKLWLKSNLLTIFSIDNSHQTVNPGGTKEDAVASVYIAK